MNGINIIAAVRNAARADHKFDFLSAADLDDLAGRVAAACREADWISVDGMQFDLTPDSWERRDTEQNPAYQSRGAKLLRRIMRNNQNPPITEIPMIHLSRPGANRTAECGAQDVETSGDYDRVNCQRCISATR